MDSDEREIINYLKAWPKQFVAAKEVCRRAGGKRRFMREPDWAYPALNRLVEKGIIETDSTGHYRFIAVDRKEKKKKWVSPQIKKILDTSGKVFGLDDDDKA